MSTNSSLLQIPFQMTGAFPENLVPLMAVTFDVQRQNPGPLAFAGTLTPPADPDDWKFLVNDLSVIFRDEQGGVQNHSMATDTNLIFDDPQIMKSMLIILSQNILTVNLNRQLPQTMTHIENEDMTSDMQAYGFDKFAPQTLKFVSDGQIITVYNSLVNFSDYMTEQVECDDSDDEDEEPQRELPDLLLMIAPKAASAHEKIELATLAQAHTRLLNDQISYGSGTETFAPPDISAL